MNSYTLLMNCHLGRKGAVIEADENLARQLAVNNVITYPAQAPTVTKVSGPEVTKVTAPEIKKRGRPAKVKDASNTTD